MSEMVSFRVSQRELAALKKAAARNGESVSALVRRAACAGGRWPHELTHPSRTATIGVEMRFDGNTARFVERPLGYPRSLAAARVFPQPQEAPRGNH